MDSTLKCVLLLFSVYIAVNAASVKADFGHCEIAVKKWAASSLDHQVKQDKHTLKDLLFFLHVPRTGGRAYFHCFLRKLYSKSQECPHSYDKLQFDPSKTRCGLLATHDDYSLMSKLSMEKTSVVTVLRNPIDRVFSTYEFSVEVAARFLVQPNLTSVQQMTGRRHTTRTNVVDEGFSTLPNLTSVKQVTGRMRTTRTNRVSTLNIWPWKYLVPWMREDLFVRRDVRKLRGIDDIKSSDPYNMEDVLMPLEKFINDPIAHDIVHNGAMFQIAGLTNNSYLENSHKVRHCVQKYKVLGKYVLQVAKKRLDNMLYVGLTEDHRNSATMFANVVGAQVISQRMASNATGEGAANMKSEQSSFFPDTELDNNDQQNSTSDKKVAETASTKNTAKNGENMTVGKLMEAYEVCISNLRVEQARRRIVSLEEILPANFTKEARLQVPEAVLQQIRSLNSLDLDLYEYAQDIFAKQHREYTDKLLAVGALENMFGNNLWKLTMWAVLLVLLFLFLLFENARREKTSKVKI
ncbi:hypothetical protein SLE2022_197470 [Rubroshorea leprosula]